MLYIFPIFFTNKQTGQTKDHSSDAEESFVDNIKNSKYSPYLKRIIIYIFLFYFHFEF